MNDTHKLALLVSLLRSYFDPELQYDETPIGAKKRKDFEIAIKTLIK
jgi:hypothetical protein